MAAGKRSYNGGMGKLLLLFIIVPAVELGLLIQVGIYLGTWPTLALIVFTGIVGAYLARRQGLSVLTCAQEQMDRGEHPAGSLADGVMILVAGALLMAPGILTDAFGFSLLVPGFRNPSCPIIQTNSKTRAPGCRRVHLSLS